MLQDNVDIYIYILNTFATSLMDATVPEREPAGPVLVGFREG
jgi:hypothetical protein